MDNPFIKYSRSDDYIIGNLKTLSSSYIPDNLPHREQQIELMARSLSSIMHGGIASNILLYGQSGSGKTSSAINVTNMLRSAAGDRVSIHYINCEIYDSHYSIMVHMVNSFIGEEQIPNLGLPFDRIYYELVKRIKSRNLYTLIILDEIDRLLSKNGSDSLYVILKLLGDTEGSIIGITNDSSFINKLDMRVRSRLNAESIIFTPYNADELRDILKFRINGVIKNGFIEDSAINLCAAIGAQEHGDARKAIELLRIAIEYCIRENRERVTIDDIYMARERFEMNILKESVKTLPIHSKMVLLSAILTQEVSSDIAVTGEIYENYKNICAEIGLQPLSTRRISDLMSSLDDLGLIVTTTRSMGRYGRTKLIKVSQPVAIKNYILEDENFKNFQGSRIVRQSKLRTNYDDI
ncbi:ORC1-type DNA replication protein [Picrophilus oshimae]|uniref:ORC1-type DNA replication protein n=2 Tax=Picrophilus torridus (strain ATCC 700027 / DSM 9790 / JCM 10055 / NBRC 100828 / KAW 2/3) TaxID=1122961 RepID=CDC6_PICTO|nr:ORC1-type DNA replication protein [Picrophilus oshimae]Q6KZL0.1 RecName: Full=ORC1-type DNA replication protein [Picrophilus oshimae DSM 9789]AAT43842.1 origin recognition complex subunit [Picrophilus oshimae DSM 9789]SMD31090.1 ORC complex protein Cdc6/Orc1 [Picrophilus oshimae DSM 9789]